MYLSSKHAAVMSPLLIWLRSAEQLVSQLPRFWGTLKVIEDSICPLALCLRGVLKEEHTQCLPDLYRVTGHGQLRRAEQA